MGGMAHILLPFVQPIEKILSVKWKWIYQKQVRSLTICGMKFLIIKYLIN